MKEQQARAEAARIARLYPQIDVQVTQPAGNAYFVELKLRVQDLRWSCLWPRTIRDALEAWACFLEDEQEGMPC